MNELLKKLRAAQLRAKELGTKSTMTEEENTAFEAALAEVESTRTEITAYEARQKKVAELNTSVSGIEERLAKPTSKPVDTDTRSEIVATYEQKNPYTRSSDFYADVVDASRSGVQPARLVESYRFETRAAEGASEAVPSDGGFLIPTDFVNEIRDSGTAAGASILPRLNPMAISGNSIIIPRSADYDKSSGDMGGGIRAYWGCEGADRTKTKPQFDELSMRLKDLTVLVASTNELLDDKMALGSWISQKAPQAITWMIEDSVVNGPGGKKPLGFLNASCLYTVAKETSQAAGTIQVANTDKMFARLTASSMMSAVWLANQSCLPQLMALKDDCGNRIWAPDGQVVKAPYGSLYGRPLEIVEYNPVVGEAGDLSLVDLSQYASIDKGNIQTAESIHVYFESNQKVFRFIYRYDGEPEPAQKTTLKGSYEVSPFVALGARK